MSLLRNRRLSPLFPVTRAIGVTVALTLAPIVASGQSVGSDAAPSASPPSNGPASSVHAPRISPSGIARAPHVDTARGMVREAPTSATEDRMIHDPARRAGQALSGTPPTNGTGTDAARRDHARYGHAASATRP